MDEGGRRSRRAAAPVFESAPSTSTRTSRSSAAHNADRETIAASPSRANRPTRSGRASVQRKAVSSSPVPMDVDEEQGGDAEEEGDDNEDAFQEADDQNEDGGEDDDDDDDESVHVGFRRRPSQSRQKAAPRRIEKVVLSRSSRQRSTAAQSSELAPQRGSRGRGETVADADDDDEEEADDSVELPTRSKLQSSPVKSAPKIESEDVDSGNISLESVKPEAESEEVDGGWIEDVTDRKAAHAVYAAIVERIRGWLGERGIADLTQTMEREPTRKTDRYLTAFIRPIHLEGISHKVQEKAYASSVHFEKDVLQLFRSCRRYFEIGSDEYGGLAALQRMYHHITQSVDAVREPIDEELLKRNCSSVRYGPCQEPEGQGYGESPCVGEMVTVPRHFYKGKALSVGMWVHLSNPTDAARPIVAQIFKARTEDLEDRRQDWITACWFLRPEQSRHLRTMTFWEDEVIKTSQMVEHHVEDVLEVICVNFYTKAARGTPADGEGGWHLGDPLYICENRFQADKDAFFKIKNWASCLPEETRYKKFHMVEYDQPINLPEKLSSPFLRGVNGPGEIVKELRPAGTAFGPVRAQRDPGDDRITTGRSGQEHDVPQLFKEWRDEVQVQRRAMAKARAEQRAEREKREQAGLSGNEQPGQSSTSPEHPKPGVAKEKGPPIAEAQDRTLLSALSQVDISAHFKTLPEATQHVFLQDAETGKVLWYPAPPVTEADQSTLQRRWNQGEAFRSHSVEYLLYRDRAAHESKRRREPDAEQAAQDMAEWTKRRELASHKTESHDVSTLPKVDIDRAFESALQQASNSLSRYIAVPNNQA